MTSHCSAIAAWASLAAVTGLGRACGSQAVSVHAGEGRQGASTVRGRQGDQRHVDVGVGGAAGGVVDLDRLGDDRHEETPGHDRSHQGVVIGGEGGEGAQGRSRRCRSRTRSG